MADSDNQASAAGMPPAGWPDLTVEQIVQEIIAYLPNPGQYQQAISGATKEAEGVIELETTTGQAFRLTVEEIPA